MLTIAQTMSAAALARQESRGVHFRSDFPQSDDKNWGKHITFTINESLAKLGK